MAKTFAILAQGSAFMHGSNTLNGDAADGRINDLFGYVAYQVLISLTATLWIMELDNINIVLWVGFRLEPAFLLMIQSE